MPKESLSCCPAEKLRTRDPWVIAHEVELSSEFWIVSSDETKLLGGEVSILVMFSLNVKYKKRELITCDFVDFALVDYLSVHAYHHFYM